MKKTLLVAFVLAATIGLLVAGVAFAQDENPPFGDRGPKDGTGLLHDYMSEAMAKALGVSVDDLAASHDAGETFYDLAIAKGYAGEEIYTLMQDARISALNDAAKDGVITQEQAEWMNSRGGHRGGMGGFGNGTCDGSGQFGGQGMRGSGNGGRFQGPNS